MLTSTSNVKRHTENGVTLTFPFDFKLDAASHLVVESVDLNGAITTLSYPADYSVTGLRDNDGGSITKTAAAPNGYGLVLRREVPLDQLVKVRGQIAFNPVVLEDALDKLTEIAQQHDEELSRTLKTSAGSDELNFPSQLAGEALAWGTDPGVLVNLDVTAVAETASADAVTALKVAENTWTATQNFANGALAQFLDVDDRIMLGGVPVDTGVRVDLADGADPAKNCGMIVVDTNLEYPTGTLGDFLKNLVLLKNSFYGPVSIANLGGDRAKLFLSQDVEGTGNEMRFMMELGEDGNSLVITAFGRNSEGLQTFDIPIEIPLDFNNGFDKAAPIKLNRKLNLADGLEFNGTPFDPGSSGGGNLVSSLDGSTQIVNANSDVLVIGKLNRVFSAAAGSEMTVFLPSPALNVHGILGVYVDGPGSSDLTLTVDSDGAEKTIDGVTSFTLRRFESALLYSDGTNWVRIAQKVRPAREVLTANRTYYVAASGDNKNDGLSVGSPFLTIQKAVDVVCNTLDMAQYQVVIQVADGTYTHNGGAMGVLSSYVGSRPPEIRGNLTTPASCILSTTSASIFTTRDASIWDIGGFTFTTATSGLAVVATSGSTIKLGPVVFGACADQHMYASNATILITADYTITGRSVHHMVAEQGGRITNGGVARAITISGTPNLGVFALAQTKGAILYGGNTYSGTPTATRHSVTTGAFAQSGASGFPGSAAGAIATNGYFTV